MTCDKGSDAGSFGDIFKIMAEVVRTNFKPETTVEEAFAKIFQFPLVNESRIVHDGIKTVACFKTLPSSPLHIHQKLHDAMIDGKEINSAPVDKGLQMEVTQIFKQKVPLGKVSPIDAGHWHVAAARDDCQ